MEKIFRYGNKFSSAYDSQYWCVCVGEGGSEGSKEEQFFFRPKTVNNWN